MSLLAASLKGTSYLIALQLVSRLLTFSLNTLILRYTTPSVFGFATIQLELLLSTILFLCRDGFRITVQRLPRQAENKARQRMRQEIVNLSYMPILLGVLLSSSATGLFLTFASEESLKIPFFKQTVLLYGLSTLLELLAEPAYNLSMHNLAFKTRALCEGLGVFVRCVTIFVAAYFSRDRLTGALPFAYGQLAYVVTWVLAHYASAESSLLPQSDDKGSWFDAKALKHASITTAQGLLKHFLTEGDKILISGFSTNAEQGTYGLAANYGGLVARIVLQPIEEASRSFFSQTATASAASDMKQTQKQAATSKNALVAILSFYATFSILALALLPAFLKEFLPVLLGSQSRWSAITPVLAAYVYYLPLLAANGVLEAFLTATADASTLRRQSVAWLGFSVAFGLTGYFLSGSGAVGLVGANAVNLTLRIVYAWQYATTYFAKHEEPLTVTDVLPSGLTACAGVAAVSVIRTWQLAPDAEHRATLVYLGKVAGLGLVLLAITAMAERQRFTRLYRVLKT